MKALIELRKAIKAKKPNFRRQDSHKKKRLSIAWRKPKGIQSKMRLSIKGYCRLVKDGFGAPRAVKGLSKEGLIKVVVSNVAELDAIDNKSMGIIISSTVGTRKRVEIIKAAEAKSLTILNIKKPEELLKTAEADLKQRREKKTQKEKKKADKDKKDKDKKKEESKKDKLESKVEKESAEPTSEEQKLSDKKEKDKILTKRGSQ